MGLVLALALGHLPAWAANPFESECAAKLKPTEIHVRVDAASTVFDYSKSTSQITAMKPSGGAGWTTLGLTVTNTKFGIQSAGSTLVREDGRACLRPSFEVKVNLNPQRVFVGSEFPVGSCAFIEVRAHELRHVETNQVYAEKVAREFEQRMRAAFGQEIYYGQSKELSAEVARVVKTGWLPFLAQELDKVNKLHERIDTPAEYARMGTLCDGQVNKVLHAQRRAN